MLRHYLGFALRHLRKSRLYSAITIGGFALGLASAILITLFIRHEVSYDDWLPAVDRTYRVHVAVTFHGRDPIRSVLTMGALAPTIAAKAAEVESAARLYPRTLTVRQGSSASDVDIMLADPSLFDVLALPVLRGDARAALKDPTSLVVTESAARQYFGTTDAIGRTITVCCFDDTPREMKVAAILRDLPPTSHLDLGLVAGILPGRDKTDDSRMVDWHNVATYTYVRLRSGADPMALGKRLPSLLEHHMPPLPYGGTQMRVSDMFALDLMNVRDIHLHALDDAGSFGDMRPLGDAAAVQALAAIGLLLLLIAISNFLNLATARAARRAREIAIRRVIGAGRGDIIVQYLGEAVLIAAIALVIGLALVELALPWFEDLAGRSLPPPHDAPLLLALVAGTVVLGLVSGIYPAIVLARLDPATVMKANQSSVAGGASRLRKVLVFSQFAAAVVLAVGTAVVHAQARHMANQDLGFDKQDTLLVQVNDPRVAALKRTLADRTARIPGVEKVTMAGYFPAEGWEQNTLIESPAIKSSEPLIIGSIGVDYDFFDTMGVKPIVGRTLSRDLASDDISPSVAAEGREYAVIANVAAVRRLGFASPAAAIDQILTGHITPTRTVPLRIVGVVPDMHFRSARFPVGPMLFGRDDESFNRMAIRYRPGSGPAVRDAVRQLWMALAPEVPFDDDLLEEQVDAQYRDEQRLADTLAGSALLALIVACLGLYGLASFLTESRMREIAIRKVLGAGVGDIVSLLGWQLARPVLLACVVAVPIAYLVAARWLDAFAYRIGLGPGLFAGVVAGAVAIAAATVALQTARAARARPVDSLRAE